MNGIRLDNEMTERGLAPSREKARALIMAGAVYVDGIKAEKAGQAVKAGASITVKDDALPFVSRGGLKLDKAIRSFAIDLSEKVCADIGASTGGFTDCMLQNGAKRVYALDVGYGQLDWKLRNDPRVAVMERTNARFMSPELFESSLDFASIDVSFISLRLILPPLFNCLAPEAKVVALIKPQFEAGRSEVGKNGVIRDKTIHRRVCAELMDFADGAGYTVLGLTYSPITGPKGNIEFLLYLQKGGDKNGTSRADWADLIQKTVEQAHSG
ncbi:MAG: TlyA family RNA methyltransferase [Clostridia bacterium]|nr:TlyA family RNA methyltransferase [Clostridia bacterium]